MCPPATPQINHDVSPDSMLILHAAEEVVSADGFDELLEGVRYRVDEIESLHRTRELTVSCASTKLFSVVAHTALLRRVVIGADLCTSIVQGPGQRRLRPACRRQDGHEVGVRLRSMLPDWT